MSVVAEEQVRAVVGHRFPGGRARIEPHVDRLLRDVIGGPLPASDGFAHPLMVFLAAQEGIGLGLEEVFALLHTTLADAPLLGEWSVEVEWPLRVGAEYEVRAQVADVVRKHSAHAGTFDVVSLLIEVIGERDRVDAQVRTSFVLPRGDR